MLPRLLAISFIAAASLLSGAESAKTIVNVCLVDQDGRTLPAQPMEKVIKTDAEWRAQLGDGEGTDPMIKSVSVQCHSLPG